MKKIRYISIYFCLFLCLLFIFINRKPLITDQDRIYIDKFLAEWKINLSPEQVHVDFNSESTFIQKLVTSVVSTINHKEIQNSYFGNIKYYYENRLGFCYDRAILMEKIFRYYHFNFRHVFVYYLKDPNAKPGVLDFFRKSTLSHAITEVETKKGWMVIDSNTDCVGIDKNGNVLNTNDLKEKADQNKMPDFKQGCTCGSIPFWIEFPHFRYVYGIYSRSGRFLSHHIGLPDVNIKMCLYNL